MEPVVHLRGAVALLGRFPALAGANLDVQRGEIVLVRGRNGAGKTTLLRVLAGLLPVTAGEAVVLGCDLRARAPGRAHQGRAARPRQRPLRRPDRRRERPLLGPHRRRHRRRDRHRHGPPRPGRSAGHRARAPALGRPAPPHGPRRRGRPPPGAVAARRAPRRARRRRPRPARRPARRGRGGGGHRRVRLPRARPGRAPRPPGRHHGRRRSIDGAQRSTAPVAAPCPC